MKTKSKTEKKKISKPKKESANRILNGKRHSNHANEPEVEYRNFKQRKNKTVDESWDFRVANTKEFPHCFHSYPAMMIPQVARRIIKSYGNKAKVLFDPFCGTGTSLVEANLQGKDAIGTDINPLARLIASAKTTKIDIQILELVLKDFHDFYFSINFQTEKVKSVIIPEIKNIDFWFSKSIQQKLGVLLGYIENTITKRSNWRWTLL